MSQINLLGEYECKFDPKGRFRMPTQLIKQLPPDYLRSFVINRGFESYLMLYPKPVWESISADMSHLSVYDKKDLEFIRYFYRGAQEVEMDTAERILVSKRLLEYAGIDKDAVLYAYMDRVEIWDQKKYDEMLSKEPSDFQVLAQDVMARARNRAEAARNEGKA